jgi:predicted transcriptional regulator
MPKQLSQKYRNNLMILANKQGLRLATEKSHNARIRKDYPLTEQEESDFLAVIETHEWSQKKVIDNFAKSMHRSVTWTTRRLLMMQAQGKIERIADGKVGGRVRYIYRVREGN